MLTLYDQTSTCLSPGQLNRHKEPEITSKERQMKSKPNNENKQTSIAGGFLSYVYNNSERSVIKNVPCFLDKEIPSQNLSR